MLHQIDLSRVDLNLLVLFETVMEERHVGRSASRLNLSPSAVSHGLGRLRSLLGDPLFLRTPRGVVPTDRALNLAGPVADILARVRSVIAGAEPFDPARSGRRFVIGAPDGASAVFLPPLLATISFTTSTYTFFATTAAPDLALTMPAFVRVAQGPNLGGAAIVYLQPSFANVGQSARVEVISGMILRVQPASGGEEATFTWQEIGRFVPDTTTAGVFRLSYEYVSDAQPLLVSQGNPQAPVATFIGPAGWYFAPGAYRITLIASRPATWNRCANVEPSPCSKWARRVHAKAGSRRGVECGRSSMFYRSGRPIFG